MLYIFRATML